MNLLHVTIGMIVFASMPTEATAHEYWLTPSTYKASTGETVSVQSFVGSDFKGELRPYATTRTVRLELQTKERKDLKGGAINGDPKLATLTLADGGGAVVAFETNFVPIELPPERFDEYLRQEGLDGPRKAREALGEKAGPGRERYARCAKTWIAGTDLSRLEKPFGLPLEIVPMGDPLKPGKFSVRVLYNSRPLEGVLVRAWNQPLASGTVPKDQSSRETVKPSTETRTNKDGVAVLQLDGLGEWLISAVHMVPSEDKKAADWESRWASLTFGRGDEKP